MRNLSDLELKKIENEIPIKVGEQIVYFRKLKGLTQTELAKMVNKDRQYIYKIEKAVVTSNIATLAIIATALEITLSQLFEKVKLPMYSGRHIILICTEAFTNAAKHANCDTIVFGFFYENDSLIIKIKDN